MEKSQAQSIKSKMDKDSKALESMQKETKGELPSQIKKGHAKVAEQVDAGKKTDKSHAKSIANSSKKLED